MASGRRRGGIHQHRHARAIGVQRSERAADHAAPRVAEEVGARHVEVVENLLDGRGALLEAEAAGQRLAVAVARRVDDQNRVAVGEVLRLRGPEAAVHQQAWPHQHRRTLAIDAYADHAEHGGHIVVDQHPPTIGAIGPRRLG